MVAMPTTATTIPQYHPTRDALPKQEPRTDGDEDGLGLDERDARGDAGPREAFEPRGEMNREGEARQRCEPEITGRDSPEIVAVLPACDRQQRYSGKQHAIKRRDRGRFVAQPDEDRPAADRTDGDDEASHRRHNGISRLLLPGVGPHNLSLALLSTVAACRFGLY